MVESNVKIIEELKQVLQIVAEDPGVRNLFTQHTSDFTRNRKLSLESVVGFIVNMPKRSLAIELREFFSELGKANKSATKAAFSQQRTKLLPLFFQVWNRWLVDAFYTHYDQRVKRWKGFRLLAVDGSTVNLMDAGDVGEEFGLHGNHLAQAPMARVMQIHDVLNDIAVWGEIFPINKSEKAILAERIEHLYKDSLTLFDRGYPSYGLMYLFINQEEPRNFVMRCTVGFSGTVKRFVKSDAITQTVEIAATGRAIPMLRENGYLITSCTTIKVRMVKVILPTGETEVLLTNLYDESIYPTEEFGPLYFLRWGIETSFGMQKNQQQMEQFSGHRALCVRQDYYAGIFTLNLQTLIENQCQPYLQRINSTRKYSYKVNKNISRANIKHNILKLFLLEDPETILLRMQMIFEQHIEPRRPDRKIDSTRKIIKYSGKFRTLTNYKRAI